MGSANLPPLFVLFFYSRSINLYCYIKVIVFSWFLRIVALITLITCNYFNPKPETHHSFFIF
jgi:hypothetical protein